MIESSLVLRSLPPPSLCVSDRLTLSLSSLEVILSPSEGAREAGRGVRTDDSERERERDVLVDETDEE